MQFDSLVFRRADINVPFSSLIGQQWWITVSLSNSFLLHQMGFVCVPEDFRAVVFVADSPWNRALRARYFLSWSPPFIHFLSLGLPVSSVVPAVFASVECLLNHASRLAYFLCF